MSSLSLPAVIADWIERITGAAVSARQPSTAAPIPDAGVVQACQALAARAATWPDPVMREEAQAIATDLRQMLPILRATSNRTPAELADLAAAEAAGDIATAAAIHDLAARDFADLVRRIDGRDDGAPPSPTELAELQALRSGIRVRIEPTDANQELYAADERGYADALLDQVDTAGTIRDPFRPGTGPLRFKKTIRQQQPEIDALIADFERYVARVLADDNPVLLAAAIRAIDALAPPHGSKRWEQSAIEAMAVELSARLGTLVTKPLSQTPQRERTHTERTPNDVLIHLMATLRNAAKRHPEDERLQALQRRGRTMFTTHAADRSGVDQLLQEAKAILVEFDPDAHAMVGTLRTQLPEAGKVQPRAQLHDNLYGRVFETKFVAALVQQPPEEFLDICLDVGTAFSDLLGDDDEACLAAAVKVGPVYAAEAPRPWSRGLPEMADLAAMAEAEADEDGEAGDTLGAIKTILVTRPRTGQEMIARLSLMAELSDQLTRARRDLEQPDPPWMEPANERYEDLIKPQRDREFPWPDDEVPATDAVGITMLHQPAAARDAVPGESTRASTNYRFGIRQEGVELDEMDLPQAIRTAHERGIPFGSGVSGTANMLLHLFWHLKQKGTVPDETPASFFLTMTAMLVGYNGGHSPHEVLWVGNLLDRDLGLGLDLGDPDDPNGFVADYEALLAKLDGEAAEVARHAADVAWEGTQDYLEQHSAFAAGSPAGA